MSFDVSIGCKHCGSSRMDFNITHNVNSIVDACITEAAAALGLPEPKARDGNSWYAARSWGRFVGWTGHDAAPIVARALIIARDPANATRFRGMEPTNGWGSTGNVIECLQTLAAACAEMPAGIIHANG